jgi:type I restriction enzyme S subunit
MNGAIWPRVRLKDLGTWFGGGTPSKANQAFWTGGTVSWLSPKDMGPEVLAGTQDHITHDAVQNSSVKSVPAGSVALVVRSGILERTLPVALVPFDTTLNQDMKAVVAKPDIEARWIAWGLRASEREILRTCRKTGTTVASMEMPRLFQHTIPIPPLDEQRRIIGILEDHLSRLDAGLHGLQLAQKRLASYEAVALSLCREGVEYSLGDLTEVQGGIQKQPKRAPKQNAYPFLRVANVTKDGLDLDDVHLVELFDGELDRLRLQLGDLLVVEGNGSPSQIGRAALWDGSIADCVHQNHLIRVRPKLGLSAIYLEAVWNSPQNRRQLTNLASSSSGLHTLSVSKLKSLKLPLPTLDRQRELVAEVQDIRSRRRRLHTALDLAASRAHQLRRSLLDAAFSGRLTGRCSAMEETEEMSGA